MPTAPRTKIDIVWRAKQSAELESPSVYVWAEQRTANLDLKEAVISFFFQTTVCLPERAAAGGISCRWSVGLIHWVSICFLPVLQKKRPAAGGRAQGRVDTWGDRAAKLLFFRGKLWRSEEVNVKVWTVDPQQQANFSVRSRNSWSDPAGSS